MIFLTVGTQFPFDRLVRAIDDCCDRRIVMDEIFAQIGESEYEPRNFRWVKSLKKADYNRVLADSSHVISHAGMGTISLALDLDKPLLVLPRLKRHGEVVNDHQVAIAREFYAAGHLLAVFDEFGLAGALPLLQTFKPHKRVSQADAVAARIAEFLMA
jgi:UDP-N-acetylglucosamine transferase subunit ALG13